MNHDEGLRSARTQAERAKVLAEYDKARAKEFAPLVAAAQADSGSPLPMNCLGTYYSNDRQFCLEVQNEMGNLVGWLAGHKMAIPKGAEYYDSKTNNFYKYVANMMLRWGGDRSTWRESVRKLKSLQDSPDVVRLPKPETWWMEEVRTGRASVLGTKTGRISANQLLGAPFGNTPKIDGYKEAARVHDSVVLERQDTPAALSQSRSAAGVMPSDDKGIAAEAASRPVPAPAAVAPAKPVKSSTGLLTLANPDDRSARWGARSE